MASSAQKIAQALSGIKRSLDARKRSARAREVPPAGTARGIAAMRAGQPVCMAGAPDICHHALRGMN